MKRQKAKSFFSWIKTWTKNWDLFEPCSHLKDNKSKEYLISFHILFFIEVSKGLFAEYMLYFYYGGSIQNALKNADSSHYVIPFFSAGVALGGT